MTKYLKNSLCYTCRYNTCCNLSQSFKQPVIHCEEFDLGGIQEKKIFPEEKHAAEAKFEESIKEYKNLKGLCSNCDNRDTCTLYKPECIVWQCEEYR